MNSVCTLSHRSTSLLSATTTVTDPHTTTTETTRPDIVIRPDTLISANRNQDDETGLEPIPDKNFRLNCKAVFLTYPQCALEPEHVLQTILACNKTKHCSVIVAQEHHKDGNKHLHVYLEFPKKIDIKTARYFNYITGKQGNYQKVKVRGACIKYVCKENRYVAHQIDVPTIIQNYEKQQEKKKSRNQAKNKRVYELIKEGKKYEELLLDCTTGPYCLLHGNKIKNMITDFEEIAMKKQRIADRPAYLHLILPGKDIDLLAKKPFKSPQFWIFGPPNVGKTSMLQSLFDAGLKGFEIPINNDFARWDDELFDFAYIDEFKGQLTIQFLNSFLQGSRMALPGKYVIGGKIKNKNIPTFILSNYTPESCYKNKSVYDLQPLLARLDIIEIQKFGDIQVICTPPIEEVMMSEFEPIGITELYSDENGNIH
ncbi:replication-associated protein [Pacific flying fox faeces associated circular DNA virus-14]|nr:replication-associated protein [Pacific flying fox faeces associated circular DNA virus-14]